MRKFSIRLIMILSMAQPAHAALELRSDLFFSSLLRSGQEVLFRSHNSLFFGSSYLKFGVVGLYEPMHSYLTDSGAGVGMKVGETQFVVLGAGYLHRKFEDVYGAEGAFGMVMYGYQFNDYFSISVPVIYKQFSNGDLESRSIIDVHPLFGLRWTL